MTVLVPPGRVSARSQADAVHLATAVLADADAFLTNNRKDFPQSIAEIAIVYPDDLPDPNEPVTGSR